MTTHVRSSDLFELHRPRLERAIVATQVRDSWSPFVESPSRKLHPPSALASGKAGYEALLGKPFGDVRCDASAMVGAELSPYTQVALGIGYPSGDPSRLVEQADQALAALRDAGPEVRVGICMEILSRLADDVFRNAFATMHTTGQAFMMAFAGSGANSLDRGLEAIAFAHRAMADVPPSAVFQRSFGQRQITLDKRYRLVPRGVAVVITCGSYPAWNAYPAIFANLATGNPVIVKPHPSSILPMAMAVEIGRQVLEQAGLDPNALLLAPDSPDAPIAKQLLAHPQTKIVDFTGSQDFGRWIETNVQHAKVYTETSGCNAVIVESTSDYDAMVGAIAQSVSLFSAQMCTAAQNILVPKGGVNTPAGPVSTEQFGRDLVVAIDAIAQDPTRAAQLIGAVQTPQIEETLRRLAHEISPHGEVLRRAGTYVHPEFPNARTVTPLVIRVPATGNLHQREHFGPVAFILEVEDRDAALEQATSDARTFGSIASYAYSTDPAFQEAIDLAFCHAGASVGINLLGQLPINFTAAFSDYHVTGLNPAGNACLTDTAFVSDRFRIVQTKIERAPA